MKFRGWLFLVLASSFARWVSATNAGPSVFSGFVGDTAWYSLISANGKVLVGHEEMDGVGVPSSERGVVRTWSGGEWQRAYFETDFEKVVVPGAVSSEGQVIAGMFGPYSPIYHAAVWTKDADGWTRTDLAPDAPRSEVAAMSADGRVVAGWAGEGNGWDGPCVWESTEGTWVRTALPRPDAQEVVRVMQMSADGRVLVGYTYTQTPPYRTRGVIWRWIESGWDMSFLPVDNTIAANSRISDLSRDGRSILGHMLAPTALYSVGRFVWSFDGSAWQWSRLPELARQGLSDPWEISDAGDVAIGTADRADDRLPVRIAWKKTESGNWSILSAGSKKENSDFTDALTGNGKLALARPNMGLWLWNLVNGKLLSMSALISGLDVHATAAGWDFTAGEFYGLGYDSEDNTYTIMGSGRKDGVVTTCVVSLYAPLLTGETLTIGGWVDIELPDLGEKGYRIGALPPGLRYDKAAKRIYGRATQTGTFTVKYRNLASGHLTELRLFVVPFTSRQQGVRTVVLTPGDSGAGGAGQLRLKVGKTGGLTAHLALPSGGKPFSFTGVLVPDREQPGLFVLQTTRSAAQAGCVLHRGKGTAAVSYRVELQLTKEGSVSAQLFAADDSLLADGGAAAP